jgi:apolipoprotein N-acyltransferase
MKIMLNRIKTRLKAFPKIYWIFVALVLVAEIVAFAFRPDSPGLYNHGAQYLPLFVSLPFIFFKNIRKNFKPTLYVFALLSFLFLALDYNLGDKNNVGHAGLIQIILTSCPIGLFWIILFARWNFKHIKAKESRTALILSCFAWGLFALAYPPMPLGPAALLILVPWFIVLNRFNRGQALFATFWSGMLYNTINYYWIYNVMHVETAPSGLILFGLFLLIAFFSAYNTLAGFIYTLAKDAPAKLRPILLVLFPVFYAGLEMTRTYGDFAFPWSHLGYVFGNSLELLQMLPYIGIFGYTILVVASNQAVAQTLCKVQDIKKAIPVLAVPVAIFALLLIQGSIVLSKTEAQPFYNADAEGNPSIALVQPSIEQGAKWSKDRFDSIVNKTVGMVNDSIQEHADLIVLAETAIPDHIRRQPGVIERLHGVANQKKAQLLVGALDYRRNPRGSIRKFDIYNASFLFTPGNSRFPERYIKKHLVPFSERIPFDEVFPILNYVDLGEGDFVAGKETPVYQPFLWTPYICYDAIFGDLVREAIREGSRLMVNITNDGWFGRSTAPYQHLNLIRYRAIENGMPVARLANSGVSAFIDQYGHFDKNTEIFTDRVVQRKMPLKTRDTLYSHIGDTVEIFLLLFFAVYLLTALLSAFKRKAS